jgi:hypothetical protein
MKTDFVWSAILAAAGAILGFVLLCIAPFAAVATVAARTLPLRYAAFALTVMWLVGQVAGFAFFHYPRQLSTFALGGAIEIAALLAAFAAARVPAIPRVPVMLPAFAAAFVTYEAVQYVFALVFGGAGEFTPSIVGLMFAGNALGLVVMWALAAARIAMASLARTS